MRSRYGGECPERAGGTGRARVERQRVDGAPTSAMARRAQAVSRPPKVPLGRSAATSLDTAEHGVTIARRCAVEDQPIAMLSL